ncbi:12907_t:CDS:1 [Rhizophagus irregularis]|nr:12907_t:CDS:1 [Rhizophagus irregularis]
MFFAKIRNSIIKKHQFHQYRFQSSYIRDFLDDKKVYIKFNKNIHIELRQHCSSSAFLSFINNNHEYLEIPKHTDSMNFGSPLLTSFLRIISPGDVDSFNLEWDCSYRLFWKDKLILKAEPRTEFIATDELDQLR